MPSFQPSHLPRIPVAAPEVPRSLATPSFVTAPDPTPPLVLPVGDILSPRGAAPPAAAATSPPAADAPLLAGTSAPAAAPSAPEVQRAPDVDLPLAPVQRHAEHPDHPGHVEGDEAPTEGADVQRAVLEAPSPPSPPSPAVAAPDAPLLADSPLLSNAPSPSTDAPAVAAPGAGVTSAADLPLAPVQRHADHPGHVEGDEAPTHPEPAEVADAQRAAVDAPVPPSAPLVGDAPPLATAPPVAAPPDGAGGPPAPDLPLPAPPVQRSTAPRRPVGLGAPIPAVPPSPVQRAPLPPAHTPPPAPTAPLVGAAPLPPAPVLPLAAAVQRATEEAGGEDTGATADADAPPLELAQRAPLDAATPAPAADAGTEPAATAPLVGQAPLEPTTGPPAATTAEAPGGGAPTPSPDLELVQRAPLLPTASRSAASASPTASSTSSAATPAAAPLPPLVVAPLLGGRPFATQVQRTADGTASAPAGLVDRSSPEALSPEPGHVYQPLAAIGLWNGAPPPDLPGAAIEAPPAHIAAAVQRATGTDVSNTRIRRDTGRTAQRLAARAFTSEGEVHIPASVGSLSTGEGASLATHELVHAGQQSVLGSSRPHEHTSEGQHLEAQARSAEHAALAGFELPTLPLAPPPAPAIQRAPSEGGGSSPLSPQQLDTLMRLADNPPSADVSVQRADTAPPPAPAVSAEPAAPVEAPAAQPQTPQELEELATKLFPAMRNLFRSELLGFRRRSGTSSDRPLS